MHELKIGRSNERVKKYISLFQKSDSGNYVVYYASDKKVPKYIRPQKIIDHSKKNSLQNSIKIPLCW